MNVFVGRRAVKLTKFNEKLWIWEKSFLVLKSKVKNLSNSPTDKTFFCIFLNILLKMHQQLMNVTEKS